MRRLGRIKCALCGVAVICMIIGTPLVLYGGLTQPMSLTKEEAWAAGINQQQALAEKQAASPARLQMFVGLGFASVGIAAGVLIWCITTAYTFVRPEDSEEEEPTPTNKDEHSPPNAVP